LAEGAVVSDGFGGAVTVAVEVAAVVAVAVAVAGAVGSGFGSDGPGVPDDWRYPPPTNAIAASVHAMTPSTTARLRGGMIPESVLVAESVVLPAAAGGADERCARLAGASDVGRTPGSLARSGVRSDG